MINYFLCKSPVSKVQYHIDSVHINIYSAEEACYFFSQNMALAEEVLGDANFSLWLETYCGIKDAKKFLSPEGVSAMSFSKKLTWFFGRVNYFTESEKRKLQLAAEELENMPEPDRFKRKGDDLLNNGKLLRCIEYYKKILALPLSEEKPDFFKANVYYNTGCAYARLFQSENAYDCFKKAYDIDNGEIFLRGYLKAYYFKEYNSGAPNPSIAAQSAGRMLERRFRELNVSEKTAYELRREIKDAENKELPQDKDEALKTWVRQYHNAVDQ